MVAVVFCCALDAAAQAPSGDAGYPSTGPISGYMDFHLNKPEAADGVLDFHRFVLILNHSFSPRLRFVAELELEHAFVEGLEEGGELELEQAYVDFLLTRGFNLRAGMLLVPMGIINERHEPPTFQGVERPFVDTVIIPTTWFNGGAGVHGELGRGFRYRAYVMAPLDALEFSADEGIRNGRQHGTENVRNAAFAGPRGVRRHPQPHSRRQRMERQVELPVVGAEHQGERRRGRRALQARSARTAR